VAAYPPADLTVERVGDLVELDFRSVPGLLRS